MENEEQKTNEEEQPKEEQEQQAPNLLAGAYQAAEQLKQQNERMERNIRKLEELKAFEMLGGKSDGRPQEVKPQEIDPKEYARRILNGEIGFTK